MNAEHVRRMTTDVALRNDEPVPALFAGDTPAAVVVRMRQTAEALKGVIESAHGSDGKPLVMTFPGRPGKYVRCEGWTTLGAMLSVFPVAVWTRPLDGGGWEARVEARTLGGALVGAAEAMCSPGEERWGKADEYAQRSMAQTRATSKALRLPLGFVMTLAGYDATPAEEMTFAESPKAAWRAPTGPKPDCPEHGAMKHVPAGTSKKTGKPYTAFWVCAAKSCTAGQRGKAYFVDGDAWAASIAEPSGEVIDIDELPAIEPDAPAPPGREPHPSALAHDPPPASRIRTLMRAFPDDQRKTLIDGINLRYGRKVVTSDGETMLGKAAPTPEQMAEIIALIESTQPPAAQPELV